MEKRRCKPSLTRCLLRGRNCCWPRNAGHKSSSDTHHDEEPVVRSSAYFYKCTGVRPRTRPCPVSKSQSPQRQRIFNRRATNHQIPNHGRPWIQNLQSIATLMLVRKVSLADEVFASASRSAVGPAQALLTTVASASTWTVALSRPVRPTMSYRRITEGNTRSPTWADITRSNSSEPCSPEPWETIDGRTGHADRLLRIVALDVSSHRLRPSGAVTPDRRPSFCGRLMSPRQAPPATLTTASVLVCRTKYASAPGPMAARERRSRD